MRILITTLGSYGDVYPHVGLARELKARDHTITLLTNPFFENVARKYGLDFVPVGTSAQYDGFANHPGPFDPLQSVQVYFDTLVIPGIRDAYQRLMEHIQPR